MGGYKMNLGSPLGCCFNVWSPLLWAFPSHPLQGEEIRGQEEMGGNLRGGSEACEGETEPPWGVSEPHEGVSGPLWRGTEPPLGVSEPIWGCLGHLGGGLSCLMGDLSPPVGCVSHLRGV